MSHCLMQPVLVLQGFPETAEHLSAETHKTLGVRNDFIAGKVTPGRRGFSLSLSQQVHGHMVGTALVTVLFG